MRHDRIEPWLLTDQNRKNYHTRLTRSMESVTSTTADTIELTRHLEGETRRLETSQVSMSDYLDTCRRTMDTDPWPSILIKLKNADIFKSAKKELVQIGFHLKNTYPVFHLLHVKIPPVPAFLQQMTDLSFIDYLFDAEKKFTLPDPIVDIQGEKMTSPGSLQPLLFPEGVPKSLKNRAADVTVCMVDSGIDPDHPEFDNRIVGTRNFTDDPDIKDRCGHGTHVAGIALGGSTGIAPHARLLVAKVLNASGSGSTEWILNGLQWAYEQGADIVNLSLGCQHTPTDGRSVLAMACDTLAEYGIVVCISAGNAGPEPGTLTSPADARMGICVAASRKDRTAGFSSRGPTRDPSYTGNKPDIAAPGVNIVSARSSVCAHPPIDPDHRYTCLSGTSMSCPMVAGLCALFLSCAWHRNLWLDVAHIKEILSQGAVFKDTGQGAGIVDGNKGWEYLEKMIRIQGRYQAMEDEEKPFGRHEVGKFINSGGFARVYHAWDPVLRQSFALKIPKRGQPQTSMETWSRSSVKARLAVRAQERDHRQVVDALLEEARKQYHMDHPAVVKVIDFVSYFGLSGIAMELMEGGSLLSRLETSGPLPVEDALPIMEDLASALHYAHTEYKPPGAGPDTPQEGARLLHFDIKPNNILFNTDGKAKLTDFGIARVMPRHGELARLSRLVCTPEYAGPEQIQGKMDPRSEIWSLGTVFYEMLTGKCCFGSDQFEPTKAKLQRIRNKKFTPVQEVAPDLPEPIADLVMTMLRSGKGSDFDSMGQVLAEIRRLRQSRAEQAPTPAKNPSRPTGHRLVPIALGVVILLVLAGTLAYQQHPFFASLIERGGISDSPGPEPGSPPVPELEPEPEETNIPDTQARQLMEAAWDEQAHHNFAGALDLFDRVAAGAANPEIQAQAAYMAGMVLHRTLHDRMPPDKRQEIFLEIITRARASLAALEHGPPAPDVRLLLGESLLETGRPNQAAEQFEHIITHFPDQPDAVNKARIFLRHITTAGDRI